MNKRHTSALIASGTLFVAFAGFTARADTVFLTNGTEVDGTVTDENDTTVSIKKANGSVQSYRKADVDTVVYDTKPAVKKPDVPIDTAEKKEDKEKDDKEGKKEKDDKEEWTPPPGLPAFPKNAKRMDKAKEEQFMTNLEQLASPDENTRNAAKEAIGGMGPDVLPYVVAGLQHVNVDARSACMRLVGALSGKTAVKFVIEVFFSAMPAEGRAATYQVPFITAIRETLPAISGQSFFTTEPHSELVQQTLTQYIDWYNANYDQIPAQLGEQKFDSTDPDYAKKLKEARKLTLAKREWPRPPLSADQVIDQTKKNNDRTDLTDQGVLRDQDKEKTTLPKYGKDADPFARKPQE